MRQNLEIEFKSAITKEKYEELLKHFNLENNVFKQTNHYFDTEDLNLSTNKIVLRIRQKGDKFKLTSKSHSEDGALETHLIISEAEASKMFMDGFDAKLINIPHFVHKVCELSTHRISTVYKNGVIFFDKSIYYGKTDYEIEFEADSLEQGLKDFESFLKEYNINLVPSLSKSKRAYEQLLKQK
ncbi:MAG: CYTH domain-containing protein [bacterium]